MSTTTLPHAGGELSSFDPQDNTCIEMTTSGTFDPAMSRCSIGFTQDGSAGFKSPTWAAAPEFWMHGAHFPGSGGNQGPVINFYDGGAIVAQVTQPSGGISNTWSLQTLQGGILTTVGTMSFPNSTLMKFAFRLVAGASGIAEGYMAGTLIFRVTGLNHSGFSGVTQTQVIGPTGGFSTYWSQIIHDTISHVGSSLMTLAPDTASVINTGWSGPVGNINKVALNDATNVTSNAAGQVSTYYKAGASLGTYNVLAVFIGARAQLTAGSDTNIQIALRSGGSNYYSSTIALDAGYQACCASWTTNPATSSAWTPSQAAVIEGGMQSIA
jgi:hypothetical protein